jgi:hypothetical protein
MMLLDAPVTILLRALIIMRIVTAKEKDMNANPAANAFPSLTAHVLGLLAVAAAVAIALGAKLPVITSHRAAILGLLVVGLVICPIGGIGRVAAANAWAHPISILSYLLAALIVVVGGAYMLGKPLPLISGDRAYLLTIAGLIFAKIALTQLHSLLR